MKDSKIEWVGEIPAEWACIRGKFLLQYKQKPVKKDDEIITCFRNGEVTLRSNRREDGFTMADKEIGYQGVDIGDLVVHGMDGFAGAIGISDSRGKASPVLNVLGTKQNKRYIMYYLRSMAYSDVFMALSTGIRVRSCDLRWNKLAELWYLVPPIEEQKRIAEFLDKKCGEVDALIADIQQDIETLEQYKRSVITEAVTKGLDPSVPMKDSGAGWMPTVPAHWLVEKIKYHLHLKTQKNMSDRQVLSLYRDYGIVPKDSRDDNHNVTSEDTSSYRYVRVGDFVVNKMKAWQGSVAVSQYEGIVSPAYFVYEFIDESFDKKYFHYLLRNKSYTTEFMRLSGGIRVGQWDLPAEAFENTLVLIPPIEEQQQIADYLDKKCKEIEGVIAEKQSQIETLESYKKSLIYEYVTGKKEVG